MERVTSCLGFSGQKPLSGVSKERVTLWSGCRGLKVLAGFLGQRPKPLGRAHNFAACGEVIVGYIWASPVCQRNDNGVPLKSCAVRPSIPSTCVGFIHTANRVILRPFRASFGIIAM